MNTTRLCLDRSTGDLKERTVCDSRMRVALNRQRGYLEECDEDDPRPYVHRMGFAGSPEYPRKSVWFPPEYFEEPKTSEGAS